MIRYSKNSIVPVGDVLSCTSRNITTALLSLRWSNNSMISGNIVVIFYEGFEKSKRDYFIKSTNVDS